MRFRRWACPLTAIVLVSCSTEPENRPPTASFSADPPTGTVDTIFEFDASGSSDPDEEVRFLQVRWDWEGDGTWDTIWGAGKVRTHSFGSTDLYSVNLEVRDPYGAIASTTREVLVGESPTAAFTITPSTAEEDTTFRFDARSSSHPVLPADSLRVRWDWEGDGVWDTEWSTEKQTTHRYQAAGTFQVTLEVIDTSNVSDLAEQELVVTAHNDPPVAAFTVTPSSGSAATLFELDASSSSDLQQPASTLAVRWDYTGNGEWDTSLSTVKTAETSYPVAGTYTIIMEVVDAGGLADTTSHSVSVSNDPPVAHFTISPAGATTATPVILDASGSTDPESDVDDLEVRWDFDSDGTWETEWSYEKVVTHQFEKATTYTVTLAIRDPGGETGEYSTPLTVLEQLFGEIIWSLTVGAAAFHTPAIAPDGTIYVSTLSAILISISPEGIENWRITDPTGTGSSPTIGDDGTIYVGGTMSRLFAYAPDGSLIWTFQPPVQYGEYRASPAIADDGTIYTACNTDTLYALNSDGSVKWRYPTGQLITSSPAIGGDGTIFIGSRDNKIHAVNPDGSQRWEYRTSDDVESSVAIGAGDEIYIGSEEGNLYSFTYAGVQRWICWYPQNHGRMSPVIGASGAVYLADTFGLLQVVKNNGVLEWSVDYIEPSWVNAACSALVDIEENVYVGGLELMAYSHERVRIGLLSFASGIIGGMTLRPDGVLIVLAGDTLHAVQTGAGGLEDSSWPKFQADLRNTGRR